MPRVWSWLSLRITRGRRWSARGVRPDRCVSVGWSTAGQMEGGHASTGSYADLQLVPAGPVHRSRSSVSSSTPDSGVARRASAVKVAKTLGVTAGSRSGRETDPPGGWLPVRESAGTQKRPPGIGWPLNKGLRRRPGDAGWPVSACPRRPPPGSRVAAWVGVWERTATRGLSPGGRPCRCCPAASYSPTRSPSQYHRRSRA